MILFRSLLHRFFRYGINENISEKKPWIVFQAFLMQLHKLRSQLRGSVSLDFIFHRSYVLFISYTSVARNCVTSADKRFWCWKLWILKLIWYGNFTIFSCLFHHHNDSVYTSYSQLDGLVDNNLFILLPAKGS